MKHLLDSSALALWLLAAHSSLGQSAAEPPTGFVNLGVGFHGPGYHSGSRPALVGGAEVHVWPNVTAGVTGSYYRYNLAKDYRFTAYSVGARASYHLNALFKREKKKLDYYACLGASYYSLTYVELVRHEGNVYVPVHVGARRLFGQRFGVFSELGFNDTGFLKVGLTSTW